VTDVEEAAPSVTSTGPLPPSPSLTPASRRGATVLAVILGAQFMVIIDETVVNVALPSMQRDLHLDEGQLSWIVNAYLLLFGGFLLLAGRMADILGRRRVFLAGLTVFTTASLVAGFADGHALLVAMRAVQGLGGAMLSPAALSILTTTFRDPGPRRVALAGWAGLLGLGATLGVLLGGVIVEYLDWPWIFWVNGPVGVLVLVACLIVVPDTPPDHGGGLDVPGAALVTGAGLLLVFTVIRTDEHGWTSATTLGGLATVAALVTAFVLWQRRTPRPLIPAETVARRHAVAYPVAVLTASALFATFFFLTLYMQTVLGWSALKTGLAWAPQGAALALVSGLAARLVPVLGARILTASGLLVAAGAQLFLLRTTVTGSYPSQILPALLLNAFGLGLGLVPLAAVAVHGLADAHHGLASGLLTSSQQLGGAVGLSVLVSVVVTTFHNRLGEGIAAPQASVTAFHTGFATSAGLMLAASVIAWFMPPLREKVDMTDLAA
jgi:EmrB/QacA subfamily drug resistance transporter